MCCKYVVGAGAPEAGGLNSAHVSNVDTGGSGGGATASTGAARRGAAAAASPALPSNDIAGAQGKKGAG